jgi:hypothetical protein
MLPAGWKSASDPSGVTYYYNRSTGASQYQFPGLAYSPPPLPPPQRQLHVASSSISDFSDEQRAERIDRLRAKAQFLDGRDRAEAEGDLAVELRRQYNKRQRQ